MDEALNKLMQPELALRPKLSDVRLAIDMRNRLIHGYSSLDVGIVWATVREDIPNLRDELQGLLDSR